LGSAPCFGDLEQFPHYTQKLPAKVRVVLANTFSSFLFSISIFNLNDEMKEKKFRVRGSPIANRDPPCAISGDHDTILESPKTGVRAHARTPVFGESIVFVKY
jgi:hypothetical protein